MLVPPPNCNPRVLHTICAIAGDNSASLLSLKENKCVLLASRQQFPIIDVKWRPLDDFMLLRCEDDSVYVWEIETCNLDRIVTGLITEDVMEACKEQIGLMDAEDEAGASQAVQMFRALKNKNVAVIKKIAAHGDDKNTNADMYAASTGLLPPMDVVQLKKCSDQAHLVLFNVDNLITGLLSMDYELSSHPSHFNDQNSIENKPSLSTLMSKKAEQHLHQNHLPNSNANTSGLLNNSSTNFLHSNSVSPKSIHSSNATASNSLLMPQRWQTETGLYMDTARLLLSLLHAWNMDENLDPICLKNLKLLKPKVPICYGTISRKGHISLYMPYCTGKLPALNDLSYLNFSKNIRWQQNKALTTVHLLSVIALSNTLMSFRSRHLHLTAKRPVLRRVSSTKSTDSTADNESQQIKQGWSNVAALHCVLLPDLVKPSTSYAAPRIDLLARRWQDNCIEIRDAAQALLIREFERLGPQVVGRRKLADSWALFLPTLLDPSLSIFGARLNSSSASYTSSTSSPIGSQLQQQQPSSQFIVSTHPAGTPPGSKPPKPVPPVPPRHPNASAHLPTPLGGADSSSSISTNSSNHVVSGNASTANSNNAHESSSMDSDRSRLMLMDNNDKAGGIHQVRRNQATAIIVLGVMGAEFPIDLQTNVDLARATSHSLLELLVAGESPLLPLNSPLRRAAIDLLGRGFSVWQPHLDISKVLLGLLDLAAAGDKYLPAGEHFGAPLSPSADACRTARHSLSLIASARPQALITALSTEVARYNSAAQHQTIQHTVTSPLLKSRMEVLRLIEQLSDKQYNCVAELIVPVGDILVHCLDTSLLKTRTLAEVFPPIAKFYMIGYCPATRRIAFGGKNGAIIVHELRASKSQGLTQSGIKCVKTLPAPSEFPVISPGGSYQQFRARLVWINNKSVTLMLPNGKENRFSV